MKRVGVLLRWYLVAILLLCFAGVAITCSTEKSRSLKELRIGHLSITDHLTLGISEEHDTDKFKHFKLKTVLFETWDALQNQFLSSELDGVFILAPLAMVTAREMAKRGGATQVVLLGHRDGSAIMVKVGSPLKKVSDLAGKTIAIPSIYSIHNMLLHKLFSDIGLNYKTDANIVVMPPAEMPHALIKDEIDCYFVAEPYGAQVEEYEMGKIFKLSRDILPNHICCVLLLNKNVISEQPAATQELVSSLMNSGHYIEDEPYDASIVGGRFLSQSRKTIYRVLTVPKERVSYNDLTPEWTDFTDLQHYFMENMQLFPDSISIDDWLNSSFADRAKASADPSVK